MYYGRMPPAKTSVATKSSEITPHCVVSVRDGEATVIFKIDPQTWARLSRKMGPQDPATFLWDNILHRAIEGAAY